MRGIILKIRHILEKDWLYEVGNFYRNINPVYRHSFWILFIITNIVFGFHTINFLWGNHDWPVMIEGAPLSYAMWEGRYGGFLISKILTDGLYLPILSALWAYAALSLSAVLLAIYWKVPQKTSYFVIFGLILNITPYTLSWLWYAHWTVNIFFGRLLILASFVLYDKFISMTTTSKILINIVIVILLNLALSIYPAYIETFVIILSGRIILEILNHETLIKSIKIFIYQNIVLTIDIIVSIIIYKIVFSCMAQNGILRDGFYNMQTIAFEDFPEKILTCTKAAWQQFTDFSMSFYPDILTKLFMILTIAIVIEILFLKKPLILKLSVIAIIMLSLLCTKIVALISPINSIMYAARVDFCGYVLFNALIVALCLITGGILKNIKIIIGCLIIYLFIVNDLHIQRTQKFGFEAEKIVWNRINEYIESNQNFNKQNSYIYIQMGDVIGARKLYYPKSRFDKYVDIDLIRYSFAPRWKPFEPLDFYNHHNILRMYAASSFNNPEYMSALKRLNDAGLLENAKAWPSKNSVIVYEDIILVITDEKDLQKAKELLAEQMQKEQAMKDKIKAKAKPIATTEPQVEAE